MPSHRLLRPRVLVPVSAGVVGAVVLGAVLLSGGGGGPTAATTLTAPEPTETAQASSTATPLATPALSPTPSADPDPTDAVPTQRPTSAPTSERPTASAVPSPTADPDRGLPPGSPPCNGFLYPGETTANPGGPDQVRVRLIGPHSASVTWTTADAESSHVEHFFVTVTDRDCTRIVMQQEEPGTARSARVDGIPDGRWYVVVREQNQAGVNGGCSTDLDVGTAPTPTGDPEPTATTTP